MVQPTLRESSARIDLHVATPTIGQRPVFLVGAQPPPVHGMAAVNAAVREWLEQANLRPVVIDLAAPSLDRSWSARLARLPKVLSGLLRFARHRVPGSGVLYMSVSGGLGQIYEIPFLALARLKRLRCFLHHHSYAYLDSPSTVTGVLAAVAGAQTTHIVLSAGMARRLRSAYPPVHNTTCASNIALLPVQTNKPFRPKGSLSSIGFLGNISAEKGVFDFLEVAEALQNSDGTIRAVLAGPFQDSATEREVRGQAAKLPLFEYVGPKYGAEKTAFFEQIDALLFPTRYNNEAEPLTVHEALMHGVPVIAYGRGCIGEVVDAGSGLVVDTEVDFVPAAVKQIQAWITEPEAMRAASEHARGRFIAMRDEATRNWGQLFRELCA